MRLFFCRWECLRCGTFFDCDGTVNAHPGGWIVVRINDGQTIDLCAVCAPGVLAAIAKPGERADQ